MSVLTLALIELSKKGMKIPSHHYASDNLVADSGAIPLSHEKVGAGKTLLVVDDEPSVREFMAQVLCQEGYNVLQADGADEALRLAAAATITTPHIETRERSTDGTEKFLLRLADGRLIVVLNSSP